MKRIIVMYDPTQPSFRSVAEMTASMDSGVAKVVSADEVTTTPSLLTKARNFATSAAKHIAAGAPRASDAEIERRFAICQGCEFYDGKACTRCGCPVVRESRFVSKLSWANESCPVGKWGKEEVG